MQRPAKYLHRPAAYARDLELKVKAFELRKANASYRQIGQQLGISPNLARAWVKDVMSDYSEQMEESKQEVKQLELDRLDQISMKVFAKAIQGDEEAIKTFLKVSEQRSKLCGLYEADENAGIDPHKIIVSFESDWGSIRASDS